MSDMLVVGKRLGRVQEEEVGGSTRGRAGGE